MMALAPMGFVVVLLVSMLAARARMGVRATPASVRRQWLVVGGGALLGVLVGALLNL